MPTFLCGPIDVRLGGEIGRYTALPNLRKWEILGGFPHINCTGKYHDMQLVVVGQDQQRA
jgi:hypothetical protein